MKHIPSVALGRHLLAIVGLALASAMASLSAAVTDTYYVSDHLATTTAVVDAAGEIASLEADAFGSPVGGGEVVARYTGKPYDADIGAHVFPFRNYRPDEARWLSSDPSGFPDGVNSRGYIGNPFSTFDPLGLVTVYSNEIRISFTATTMFGSEQEVFARVRVAAIGNDSPASTATITGGVLEILDSDMYDFFGGVLPVGIGFGTTLTLSLGDVVDGGSQASNNGKTLTQTYQVVATGTTASYFGIQLDSTSKTSTATFTITHSVSSKE